jgi:hypothetical protein
MEVQGVVVIGSMPNFQDFGDCNATAAATSYDVEITTELGCLNGVQVTRITEATYDTSNAAPATFATSEYFRDADGSAIPTNPGDVFTLGACPVDSVVTAVNGVESFTEATSGTGTVVAGKNSVTFLNISGEGITVDGVKLNVTESVTFDAYLDPVVNQYVRTSAHAWVITGTGNILHITTKD